MSAQRLFEVIGLVDDGLLQEAESYRKPYRERHWARWGALAACAVLVIGGVWLVRGGWLGGASSSAPGASGGASAGDGVAPAESASPGGFMFYAGPVLPLNAEGDLAGLTAERGVTYTLDGEADEADITDHYTLTNATGEDKTLRIYYPYAGNLNADADHTPTLTLDGETLETALLMGDSAAVLREGAGEGENPKRPTSWKDYGSLLENGAYFDRAKRAELPPDCPVTVYTFQDVSAPEEYGAARLAIDFTLPEGARPMAWGMNGMSWDDESRQYRFSYSVHQKNTDQKIIILGEPPSVYTVSGYTDGTCQVPTPEVTGWAERSESTLYRVLRECLGVWDEMDYSKPTAAPEELRLRAALDYLDDVMIEDMFSVSADEVRVLYRTAEITVPANATVELTADYRKDGSHDFEHASAEKRGVEGYDLATTLGSGLTFTGQRVALELPAGLEIVRQNFGFDIVNGVTEVELDLNEEYYFLEVRRPGE